MDKREWREKHAQLAKEIQTLLEQQEAITKKNQHDNKLNRKLSVKVEHLKEENRKALTTVSGNTSTSTMGREYRLFVYVLRSVKSHIIVLPIDNKSIR